MSIKPIDIQRIHVKVSTKGDYATRALQDLAIHYDQGPVPIETIAHRQGLPVRYLEQLLLGLKRAGFRCAARMRPASSSGERVSAA